ncbi:Uncharacterised protein [Vibrio cholerae]|nr:Uncharacterised protein [Vibrio cholerae]
MSEPNALKAGLVMKVSAISKVWCMTVDKALKCKMHEWKLNTTVRGQFAVWAQIV